MARDSFETQLADLEDAVFGLGETVADRLERALTAYREHDGDLAHTIAESDGAINDRYLALESDCVDLFALQQPVATDLRFVAASFKIATDLERIGDLAANLAGYSLELGRSDLTAVPVADVGEMVHRNLLAALAAYRDRDPAACRAVAADDHDVDERCEAAADDLVRSLVGRERNPTAEEIEPLLADARLFMLTVRDLERVGDHAVNVAARTLYAVDGDPELIR